ncbi:MAG TPA: acetamidase/formamidase family protein [Candidatus Binataceae bacterium]|nr:acetamidase/formamidase family protein [Candidatus Binataceae bacterium]
MSQKELRLDKTKRLSTQSAKGHNRWHPSIAPVLKLDPGDEAVLDTLDALDCQIGADKGVADAAAWDLNAAHPLTGPIWVNGAAPGDLLEVTLLEILPSDWGWTAQLPGFGFLRDLFPQPHLVQWRLHAGYAEASELPGVRIPEAAFPGVIGVAPSLEQLERITIRERETAARGGVVMPPEPRSAIPNIEPIASQGLRTIPPRETGGNLDVKQLVKGTTVYLPVWTEGALFSIGDAHFAQGDGEVCGSAIEMAATFTLRFDLQKGAARERKLRGVQFSGSERAGARRYHATTGLCMRSEDVQESEDATLAARNALLAMIDYLEQQRGFSRQQAYAICSVAVDLRLSEVVDVPNFVVTAFLPLDIFVA